MGTKARAIARNTDSGSGGMVVQRRTVWVVNCGTVYTVPLACIRMYSAYSGRYLLALSELVNVPRSSLTSMSNGVSRKEVGISHHWCNLVAVRMDTCANSLYVHRKDVDGDDVFGAGVQRTCRQNPVPQPASSTVGLRPSVVMNAAIAF